VDRPGRGGKRETAALLVTQGQKVLKESLDLWGPLVLLALQESRVKTAKLESEALQD